MLPLSPICPSLHGLHESGDFWVLFNPLTLGPGVVPGPQRGRHKYLGTASSHRFRTHFSPTPGPTRAAGEQAGPCCSFPLVSGASLGPAGSSPSSTPRTVGHTKPALPFLISGSPRSPHWAGIMNDPMSGMNKRWPLPPAADLFGVDCINIFSCCQAQSANCLMNYLSTQKVLTRTVLTLIPNLLGSGSPACST